MKQISHQVAHEYTVIWKVTENFLHLNRAALFYNTGIIVYCVSLCDINLENWNNLILFFSSVIYFIVQDISHGEKFEKHKNQLQLNF